MEVLAEVLTVKEVKPGDYYNVIQDCYSSDPMWDERYSIKAGEGTHASVLWAMDNLSKTSPTMKFKGVYLDNKLVGYYVHESGIFDGKETNSLTLFFAKPEIRNKEGLSQMWDFILIDLDYNFITGNFKRNDRMTSYLEKRGCKKIGDVIIDEEPYILWKYSN